MARTQGVRGEIPAIIRNRAQAYEGDLGDYFRIIFNRANNLFKPYHNFGHLFYVLWRCHQACIYYKYELSERERRNLLIAAMFHDADHTGRKVPDIVNITRAVVSLKKHCSFEDKSHFLDIADIIRESEYPYRIPSSQSRLTVQILRDADASQALSPTWFQHTIFGLAAERGTTPFEILNNEVTYLTNLRFTTEWAQKLFPQYMIEDKLAETRDFLSLIFKGPAH